MKKAVSLHISTAGLMIAIAFATTIIIFGGNARSNRIAYFIKTTYQQFDILVATILFTSTSSLMLFLSILTSCFTYKDFLCMLLWKLRCGIVMLFLSLAAMLVCTVYGDLLCHNTVFLAWTRKWRDHNYDNCIAMYANFILCVFSVGIDLEDHPFKFQCGTLGVKYCHPVASLALFEV